MGPSWLRSAVQPPGGLLLPLGLQSSLLPSPPNESTHPLSCPWCKELWAQPQGHQTDSPSWKAAEVG